MNRGCKCLIGEYLCERHSKIDKEKREIRGREYSRV